MKKIVLIIVALVVIAAIGGGLYFYKLKAALAKAPATNLPSVTVARGNVISSVSTSGTVVLQDQQALSFGISGTITQIKVDNGSLVKKGDLLAVLDTVSLERALAQAKANLDAANIKLSQTKNPYKDSDIIAAEGAVVSARSSLISAQKSLDDYMTLYATTDFTLAQAAIRNDQLTLQSALLNQTLNLRVQNNAGSKPYEQALQDAKNAREIARAAYLSSVYSSSKTGNTTRNVTMADLISDDDYHLRLDPKYLGFITPDSFPQTIENLYWAWINADTAYGSILLEEQKNVADLQNAVDKAKDQISKDQNTLDQVNQWPKPGEIGIRKSQIESAQQSVKKAEASLADIKAGADPLNVALSENQLMQSQISLDTAKDNLDKASLFAPFDGVIFNRTGNVGDTVGGGTAIMQIVNPNNIRIDGLVSEVDISNIKNGQAAALTFDALSGITMSGKVNNISYVATKSSGVTNFLTQIGLDVTTAAAINRAGGTTGTGQQPSAAGQGTGRGTPGKTGSTSAPGKPGQTAAPGNTGTAPSQGRQPSSTASPSGNGRPAPVLRDGMSAMIVITTDRRDGILTVPNKAIQSQGGNKILNIKVGDTVTAMPVRTGLSDGSNTEIISGVEEGDIVVIVPTQVRSTTPRPGTLPGKIGF